MGLIVQKYGGTSVADIDRTSSQAEIPENNRDNRTLAALTAHPLHQKTRLFRTRIARFQTVYPEMHRSSWR